MRPATLHVRGVGVIINLYLAIFAEFKESMTLNLAQRSSKVIDFGTGYQSKGCRPIHIPISGQ